jgi:uncharacterized linocin/CFP29 family protein
MNDLKRELAPISDKAWSEIETEVKDTLNTYLAGRKLVDFHGPVGWDYSAINIGKYKKEKDPVVKDVETRTRITQPLVELRTQFELSMDELDSISRGLDNPDLDPVRDAAQRIALAEDNIIFYGYSPASFNGICTGKKHQSIVFSGDFKSYPANISEAVEELRESGVEGPYAIALSPDHYKSLASTVEGGYPIINHVKRLINGPIVWAPAIKGAVIISMRGGDFELTTGRDISVGYLSHNLSKVLLYLEESLTFRLLEPEAVISIASKN